MAIETAKDKIMLSQMIGQKQETIIVDGDVIVNDVKPDVLKVINTNGVICVYKKEVLNGKIKLEGCINTYIIYLADDKDSNIRTLNTSLDFAEIIDMENCTEDMLLDETLTLKGFETKILNGRKLHVKAIMDANFKVYSNSEVEAIVDIGNSDGDIQMLNCNKMVLSLVGENTGKTTLKDTINIPSEDNIAEKMKVSFSISDIETKTSYNKVLIKANANIGIMYLTEDNRISVVNAKIPIMGFIDMPNVTDNCNCISQIKLKNMVLRQNTEEENSIYIEADLDLSCKTYENKEINVIEDLYSITNNTNIKKLAVNTKTGEIVLKDTLEIRQKLTTPELMYGRIIGVNVIPFIENTTVNNGKIKTFGKLDAEFLVESENNINTINNNIPFEFELQSSEILENSNIDTQINVVTQKIENADDGGVLFVQLEITANVQNSDKLNLVQDIEILDPLDSNQYSMVIYFVKPGDTLWKIAKQFRSRVEDIARVNNIEDENKIYPGEQLYIPKFIKNKVSV